MPPPPSSAGPPPLEFNLADIYYTLSRHKWKIITLSVIGLIAAAVIFFATTPLYQSEAKLLVLYVIDTREIDASPHDSSVQSPRGDNIINSELEILTSMDLCLKVADLVGPEKILASAGGGNDRTLAAVLIHRNLRVEVPSRSSVIRVTFQYRDPSVVQVTLQRLIEVYLQKHAEVHRGLGSLDQFLIAQTDVLRGDLAATEKDLRDAKAAANIVNLDDSKKEIASQISKIESDLLDAESELAERKAALQVLEAYSPKTSNTETNQIGLPSDTINEYKSLNARLDSFQNREFDLITQYTDEHPTVKALREQIAEATTRKQRLEKDYPALKNLALPVSGSRTMTLDPASENARIASLEAKTGVLTNLLQRVRAKAANLQNAEATIVQLQRKRDMQEATYRNYSASLQQAQTDDKLGASRLSNIGKVEDPTTPAKMTSKLLTKVALAACGGIGFGLALAFGLEMFVDQTFRRPRDLEKRLKTPIFVSIPQLRLEHKENGQPGRVKRLLAWNRQSKTKKTAEIAPWDSAHELHTYFEALRDRLMLYFEKMNLTHHPKLVGITSCTRGAGVSTIATGLAAAMSQTGDGNVLVVDMNIEQGAAHPFFRGKPSCGLFDILEPEKREEAQLQQNLFLAKATNGHGESTASIPGRRFIELMPKLKASDYDYIIFDLPPITQTSVTLRLASFMDKMLYVVESEKSQREATQHAINLIKEAQPRLSVIFNKTRTYLPQWLHQEI